MAMELSPFSSFQLALQRWWWVTLFTILGGIGGWAFHTLQPPLYDAAATFTVAIDFAQTGPITEREQDQSINAFMQVIQSPKVVQLVTAELSKRNMPAGAFAVGRTAFLERRQYSIELHVRNNDPQLAAELATLWSEHAYTVLVEAYSHALKAASLRQFLASLNACLQIEPSSSETLCEQIGLDELELRIEAVTAELQTEQVNSGGLLSALVFNLAIPAEIPRSPISYDQTWLILAGVFIGLVMGCILAIGRLR